MTFSSFYKIVSSFIRFCIAIGDVLVDDVNFSETVVGDGHVGFKPTLVFSPDRSTLQPVAAVKSKAGRGESNRISSGALKV